MSIQRLNVDEQWVALKALIIGFVTGVAITASIWIAVVRDWS